MEDEDDELELELDTGSFFSHPGDDALPLADRAWDEVVRMDDAICSRVWSMFVKWQNGRGYAVRNEKAEAGRLGRAAWEAATTKGATTMATVKRGELGAMVLGAYHEIKRATGEEPRARDVFDRLGEAAAKNAANVSMCLQRLRKQGKLDGPAPTKEPTSTVLAAVKERKRAAKATSSPRPKAAPKRSPTRRSSSSSADVMDVAGVLAGMVTLRTELEAKVAALNAAIDALR